MASSVHYSTSLQLLLSIIQALLPIIYYLTTTQPLFNHDSTIIKALVNHYSHY